MALAHVQSAANGNEGGTNSLVITMPGALTAGNAVVLWVAWASQVNTISSVTGGGTYDIILAKTNDTMGDGWAMQGFICKNLSTGPTTITIAFSGSQICCAHASEFSGQDTTTASDATPPAVRNQINPGTATDAIAANAVTPATAGAYVVSFAACPFSSSFTSIDVGTGWTNGAVNPANNARSRSEYKLVASPTATTATFTQNGTSGSPDFISCSMVLRPASGGGGSVTLSQLECNHRGFNRGMN